MKHLLVFFAFVGLFVGCRDSNQPTSVTPTAEYVKVSSETDSLKEKYVIYRSRGDTAVTMLRYYWDNGGLQAVSFFRNGKRTGHWLQYFENGTLSFEGNFTNDKKNGAHKFYYPNGKVSKVEYYNADNKVGTWSYYDSLGRLSNEVVHQE